MGWPIWLGGRSYRVCLDCGIQQLFDEGMMRGYGPYAYDLDKFKWGLGRK
jgi:hypothetical protein